MAEEGTKSDGQQSDSNSMAEANAEAQLAAHDRAAFSSEAYTFNTDPHVMDRVQLGWVEAVAKDERTAMAQKAHARHTAYPGRTVVRRAWDAHHHITRSEKLRHQEYQQTRRDIQAMNRKPHPSDVPYGEGTQERFWGKITMRIFRMLGLD